MLSRKNHDYIIQAGIVQDPEISRIYPESVNTCRIITENKNGTARIVVFDAPHRPWSGRG